MTNPLILDDDWNSSSTVGLSVIMSSNKGDIQKKIKKEKERLAKSIRLFRRTMRAVSTPHQFTHQREKKNGGSIIVAIYY